MSEGKWQDSIESEELRHSPVLSTFKTPEDAYKGLVELKLNTQPIKPLGFFM